MKILKCRTDLCFTIIARYLMFLPIHPWTAMCVCCKISQIGYGCLFRKFHNMCNQHVWRSNAMQATVKIHTYAPSQLVPNQPRHLLSAALQHDIVVRGRLSYSSRSYINLLLTYQDNSMNNNAVLLNQTR